MNVLIYRDVHHRTTPTFESEHAGIRRIIRF
jgi:hypothetical protein